MWLLILPCIDHAQGNSEPLVTSSGSGDLFSGDSVTVGSLFTIGVNPITVTALGLFESSSNGLAQAHSIGLWTAAGSLLATVSFLPGTNSISLNGFLYQSLATQYVLPAGTSWVLGAYYPSGTSDLVYANDSSQSESWSSVAQFNNGRYTASGAGFVFPSLNVHGLSYVGPNILYAVPEPNAWDLFFCSVMVYALWRVQ